MNGCKKAVHILLYGCKRLPLIFFGVAVGLGFMELTLHLFPSLQPLGLRVFYEFQQNYTQPDEDLVVRGIPNLHVVVDSHPEYTMDIQLNSLGYRDPLTEGKVHIIAVGDSFTFGTGVEYRDCYVEQLETLTGKPCVSLGIGGYGPGQYTRVLQQDGDKFEADVVLFAIFGNDWDNCGGYKQWLERPSPRVPQITPIPTEEKHWPKNSREWRKARVDLLTSTRVYRLVQWNLWPDPRHAPYQTALHYCDGHLNLEFNEGILEWIEPDRGGKEENWQLLMEAIREAQDWAKSRGVRLVVLYLPSKEEAYSKARLGVGGSPAFDEKFALARNRLGVFCTKEKVSFLDLTPGFQQHAEGGGPQTYFRWDGHWNATGHSVAAHLIHEFLLHEGLTGG